VKDFFVSYNSADKAWAEWIAWVLEENGYTVIIQAWDFRPGGNFILDMQQAAEDSQTTIMVLSDHYLKAQYTQPEWAAAFAKDPTGTDRRLLPIRVGDCQPTGMLRQRVYVDLVSQSEADAEQLVLGALQARAKPSTRPSFPGSSPPTGDRVTDHKVEFPGARLPRTKWQIVLDYQLENTFDHGRVVDRIVDQLKQFAEDASLEEVKRHCHEGSTFLTLTSTQMGFSRIETLCQTGQLSEINTIAIEHLQRPLEQSQQPIMTPDSPSPSVNTPLTPRERLALSRSIAGLTVQDFNDLLLLLSPPHGIMPPPTATQGDRTYALLNWAQSTTGPGLGAVQAALREILP